MLRLIVATGLSLYACFVFTRQIAKPDTISTCDKRTENTISLTKECCRLLLLLLLAIAFFYSSFSWIGLSRVRVLNATMIAFSWAIPLNDPLIIIIIIMHSLFRMKIDRHRVCACLFSRSSTKFALVDVLLLLVSFYASHCFCRRTIHWNIDVNVFGFSFVCEQMYCHFGVQCTRPIKQRSRRRCRRRRHRRATVYELCGLFWFQQM